MATHKSRRNVRYAVVGLGHIAQMAVLPAFAHARRNSELAAIVSGDAEKLDAIGRMYDVEGAGRSISSRRSCCISRTAFSRTASLSRRPRRAPGTCASSMRSTSQPEPRSQSHCGRSGLSPGRIRVRPSRCRRFRNPGPSRLRNLTSESQAGYLFSRKRYPAWLFRGAFSGSD